MVAGLIFAGVLWLRRDHLVAIHGDGTIIIDGRAVDLDQLAAYSFTKPVLIRTFSDTSPILMHRVIDRIDGDAQFEDGKFKGYRPDFGPPQNEPAEQDAGGKRGTAPPDSLRSGTVDPALPQL